MKKTEQLFHKLKEQQLIALLTPRSVDECVRAYELLENENITLEIAFRSPFALRGLQSITAKYPDAMILAGTIMTAKKAEEAIKSGALGIVSADFITEVAEICCEADIMYIPGGLSDVGKQLSFKANSYKCSLENLKKKFPYQWVYKLFPAVSGDNFYAELSKAISGPYQDLTFIYTGGINLGNLKKLYLNDYNGVFCASALTRNLSDPERFIEDVGVWKEAIGNGKLAISNGMTEDVTGSGQLKSRRDEMSVANEELNEIKERRRSDTAAIGNEQLAIGNRKTVVTFGEFLMRLSPRIGERLSETQNLDMNYGGAEANVAVSLAQMGLQSKYISIIPDNPIGDNGIKKLHSFNVDVNHIQRKGDRLGLYFLEHGAGQRPSKVLYDRSFSSFSEIKPDDFDWDEIFEGASWFHWTGITPAVSDAATLVLKEAIAIAKSKNITISADLNYRKKLWSIEKAREVMSELLQDVDVLIANEEDPKVLFNIADELGDLDQGEIDIEIYDEISRSLDEMFDFKKVAITLRQSISASVNNWSACLYSGGKILISPEYNISVIDRVGSGDAFAAGLIYSLINNKDDRDALNFATAAACIKHSIKGDFNVVSVEEVEYLAEGFSGGRVQR